MTDTEIYHHTLTRRLERIKEVLSEKNAEYSTDKQPYHNFDAAAEADGVTPEQALWGMFLKHYVSVRDMVKGGKTTPYMIDEKIGDCINYFILLEGLLIRKLDD